MRIYLIGITGAGKTTLGMQLAGKLEYQFIDLDAYIIAQEKRTIEDIFKDSGEAYFRKLEGRALSEISIDNVVISTGGGAPCFFDHMQIMNVKGVTVWLNPDAEVVADRLLSDPKAVSRPMLKDKSRVEVLEFIKLKIQERQKYYSKAEVIITHNNITADMILKALS